jgi:hypothetical protein
MPEFFALELQTPVVIKTSSVTLLPEEMKVLVDATAGAITITPPTNPLQNGRLYSIKKIDSTANAVTFNANVDDQPNYMLRTQYKYVQLVPNPNDTTKWSLVGNN